MDSADLNAFGSRFPTSMYCERNSLSQGSLGRSVWTEALFLGAHAVVRFAISLIRYSNASNKWENDLFENSNLAMRESFFSLSPITTEVFPASDSSQSESEYLPNPHEKGGHGNHQSKVQKPHRGGDKRV